MKVLRAADYLRMPWRNGGGETTEVAIGPPGASLDDFDWRVSMAPVLGDGPFSRFDGVDRTLAILEGAGLALTVGGASPIELTGESAPYAFAGDVTTSARLLVGPIVDLNVMTRRDRWHHAVARRHIAIDAEIVLAIEDGALAIVLARDRGIVATATGARVELAPREAIVVMPGAPVELRSLVRSSTVFLIQLAPR